ncbi:hypothetical protein BBJ28_00022592 [Nothophytophthora sp. Chile5]|nr:hypothetical protein BBJ28_00022592 [Nothophytophthora sp. Chile5]
MASAASSKESAARVGGADGGDAVSNSGLFVRVAHAHGVRRRREDAVEIEELDSTTMRQNSYNYFQHHGSGSISGSGSAPSLLRTSTFRSSLGRSPASRKRQRTLAEQLDELNLQGTRGRASGVERSSARSRSNSARRQARERVRGDGGGVRIVELDEFGREKPPSMDGSGSDSDGMMDTGAMDRGDRGGLAVYGNVPGADGLRSFFAAGAGAHHRPMDRMYRHYVAVAANSAAASTPQQGNELVVFRSPSPATGSASSPSFSESLPAYLSLTPREFEKLTMAEKRQWYQAHSRYMRQLDQAEAQQKDSEDTVEAQLEAKSTDDSSTFVSSRRRSSSGSSSRSFQVLGVPSTDEEADAGGDYDDYGEDVEMMEIEDVEDNEVTPKGPHSAGTLTHTEWFTDDEL